MCFCVVYELFIDVFYEFQAVMCVCVSWNDVELSTQPPLLPDTIIIINFSIRTLFPETRLKILNKKNLWLY